MRARSLSLTRLFVALALVLAPLAQALAQDEEAQRPPLVAPTTVEEAVAVDADALKKEVADRTKEELAPVLTAWMRLVEEQQNRLESVLEMDEASEERKAEGQIRSDRDALVARTEVVLRALAAAGGDVDRIRDRIASMRADEASEMKETAGAPADAGQAAEIDVEVLRAQLRPLTKEQVEEQLASWMELLQAKCLEVRNVEVAALQSKDPAEIEKFNARAVEVRAARGRLIKRVEVVIEALDKKGGEVKDAKAYVSSVVVQPPISGWRAALTTAKAWALDRDGGIELALRVGKAIAIVIGFWILARLLTGVANRALRSIRGASALLKEFITGSIRKLTLFVGVLIALGALGVNMGPMLAAIGAAGLVIGLALQGTLSNFASGIMIMFYRPFDVGDAVSTAGIVGKVKGMTLVTTTISTFDNQTMHVPNNMVWGSVITNITANKTRRVDMKFGISYGDDVRKAKELLMRIVKDNKRVLADPEPVVELSELADSSVNFIVRPWAKTDEYWNVFWEVTQAVKEQFDAEGISIPFPQRDVHFYPTNDVTLQPVARPDKAGAPAKEQAKT